MISTLRLKVLLLLIFPFITLSLFAQINMRKPLTVEALPDSIDLKHYNEKHWGSAIGQVVGLNLGVWAFDRYITKAEFAYISKETIKTNLTHGFVWDNDQIGTNLFLHPYHGSLYYNAARSNGFSYLQSSLYTLGGSLMWELFLENEYPSINDAIATPVGGTAFGEVAYRSSDLILDDRKVGSERFTREFLALLISPTRGLTRIINGDAWRKRSTSGRQFGIPKISLEISFGLRALELRDNIIDEGVGLTSILSVEYGNRFETDGLKPYEYFTINGNLNLQKGQPALGEVNILGRLWGDDLLDTEKDYFNIGVYQYYDYFDSDVISDVSDKIPYKFGTPASFGLGVMHKSKRFANWDFNSSLHITGIILGASLSDHYRVDKRNYNLGNGFGWKMGASIAYKDLFGVAWWHEGFNIFTWKGYPENFDFDSVEDTEINFQGDESYASLNKSSLKVDVKLKGKWYASGMYCIYRRSTDYRFYPDVFSLSSEGKLLLTYKF